MAYKGTLSLVPCAPVSFHAKQSSKASIGRDSVVNRSWDRYSCGAIFTSATAVNKLVFTDHFPVFVYWLRKLSVECMLHNKSI